MIYLNTFLYYTFFASAILFYGLGINQIAELNFMNQKSANYDAFAGSNIDTKV